MDVRTFGELIDWTRQLHEHLAACLAHCADIHEEERARMLLNYLAAQEAEMQRVVARFEQTADAKALKTYVFDFHEQTINLYRTLVGKAEIPEAKELLDSLLALEEHEAMRLVRQTGRMNDV